MNDDILLITAWLESGSINIFGRPFAGKDTQGNRLAKVFSGKVLGGGDILRNSIIPPHVNEVLKRGELIPSQDFVDIVLPYLSNDAFLNHPLILSSVGRWIGEEEGVIAATKASNHELKCVIYLDVTEEEVIKRWKALASHDDRGGRHDDTEEILATRLEEYRNKTLPVLEKYRTLGLLETIDGSNTPDLVYSDIVERLLARSRKS